MIIYHVIHRESGRIYVGRTTKSLRHRWARHVYTAARHVDNSSFHRAINKFGSDAFDLVVVAECRSREEHTIREYDEIARLKNDGKILFNDTLGGNGSFGFKHSIASRIKIRDIAILRYRSGATHPRSRPCAIDGVMYASRTDAAKVLGVTQQQASRWAVSGCGRKRSERSDKTHGYVRFKTRLITA